MGRGRARRLLALCLVVVAWGCVNTPVRERAVVRGPGLPPTTLVAPFRPWSGSAPVPADGLLTDGEHAQGPARQPPVAGIEELAAPEIEEVATDWNGHLRVTFNRDVCPVNEAVGSLLELTPPSPGIARWHRANELVFIPTKPWLTSTKITVRVSAKLCSTAALSAPQMFETVHRPLDRAYVDGPSSLAKREGFRVSFDERVEASAVQSAIVVEQLDAADTPVAKLPVTVRVATPKNKTTIDDTFTVEPEKEWPRNRRLRVTLGPTMRGLGGAPLERSRVEVLRTWGPQKITAGCSREVERKNCTPGRADARGLEIVFRNPLAQKTVAGIVVSPRPKGMRMSLDRPTRFVITGELELGKTYDVTVPAGLVDRFGQRTTEKTQLAFTVGLPLPSIAIHTGARDTRSWRDDASMRVDRAVMGITTRRLKSVRLRIARVPDDRLADFLDARAEEVAKGLAPIVDRTLVLSPSGPTQFSSLPVDLAKLLGQHRGAFAITVSAAEFADPKAKKPEDEHFVVQVSDVGLTVGASPKHGLEVRVAKLADGRPVAGAEIAAVIRDENGTKRHVLGTTDAAGHLHVSPRAPLPVDAEVVVVARSPNGDEAFVEPPAWAEEARKGDGLLAAHESLLGHLVTERGIYRPGETIHVVAWGKIAAPGTPLGRRALPEGTELSIVLEADEVVSRKTVKVGLHGKVVASFELDAEAKPGRYMVTLSHRASSQVVGKRSVRVEHYRTPTFKAEVVDVKRDGLARATFVVKGKHYSGEALDIVGATIGPSCYPTRPQNDHFGIGDDWELGYTPEGSKSLVEASGATPTMVKPAREVVVRLDGSALPTGRAESCGVDADLLARTLQSQSVAHSPEVWLYGTPDAVALRVSEPKRKNERRIVSLRSLTHVGAGKPMKRVRWPEPVDVVLVGPNEQRETVCTLRLGDRRDARCRLGKLEPWESYDVEVRDSRGVLARSWFYERPWAAPTPVKATPKPQRVERCAVFDGVKQCHEVELNPEFNAKSRPKELLVAPETSAVLVGDRARIAVRGPYNEASGLLIVRTVGASQAIPFTMKAGRAVVVTDVLPTWEPGVELLAWVTPPAGPKTTATHHRAEAQLDVTVRDRALVVRIEAPNKALVRQTKKIDVVVTDPSGKPVQGRVAIWVSDRAVLDLTYYRLPSTYQLAPHPELHDMWVGERYGALVMPFEPREEGPYFVHGTGYGQGFGSGHGRLGRSHRARPPRVRGGATSVLHERGDFQTTPLFVGDVATDAQGRATVELTLPDNITEFVVLAVASATLDEANVPERFGRGRASIIVGKSLVLTAALPQHLRPGDRARVAAVVRNNGETPIEVDVAASAEGETLSLSGTTTHRITIAAGTDRRVSFDLDATKVGTSKVRMKAVATSNQPGGSTTHDAVVLPLTVAEERLRYEEDGLQGVLVGVDTPDERGVTIPVQLADGISPSDVEARVSFGRSPITGLEAAAAALMRFPYGCVEQLSSKLVPLIAVEELRDLGVVDQNPDQFIAATVRKILDHQRDDGGFGLWSATDDAHAYGSAWATWVLVRAHRAGVRVPDKALKRAVAFAERLYDGKERFENAEARALALLAIAEHGKSAAWVQKRIQERLANGLPKGAFELGMLAMSLRHASPQTKQRVLRALTAMLVVRGDQAGLAGPILSHGAPMGARVPATAAVMMGLMALDEKGPILQKLAAGLLARRHRGRWLATQDNAFGLLALSRYAQLIGKPVPVRAKGWVGTTPVIDEQLTDARPIARGAWTPLPVKKSVEPHVTVQRIGKGPVHYMLRVRRMRAKGEIPKSRVLSLKRTLRTATGPVSKSVTAGQLVALDIEWHTAQPVSYVAIDVPLPAGLEPAIGGLGGQLDRMLGDDARASSPLVSHQQALPDRVVIFVDRVPPGTHRHTVYVRAVTPGTYDFPAARAMAQYSPGVQGWSKASKLSVTHR